MVQKDRHPGTREEDELYLVPGSDSPVADGGVTYKTGVGFRFYEEGTEKGLTGTGLSEQQHKSLDILEHNISEDCHEEVTRSSGRIVNVVFWTSAAKTTKVRETVITRTAGKISQIDTIQYDASGIEAIRMTGVVSRSSGRVSTVTWTETIS